MLRIVVFVADRGKSRNRNKAQSVVPGVRREFRDSDSLIQAAIAVFLKTSRRDSVQSKTQLINKIARESMIQSQHEILRPARQVHPIPRNARIRSPGERLIQIAVGKAVSGNQTGFGGEGMIHAHIKAIVAVPPNRRGNVVLTRHCAIGYRIQIRDSLSNAVDQFRSESGRFRTGSAYTD